MLDYLFKKYNVENLFEVKLISASLDFKLLGTDYHFVAYNVGERIFTYWYHDPEPRGWQQRALSFQEVFNNIPPEIQLKFINHLDLFKGT